jgi:RHS repeat-associated protein
MAPSDAPLSEELSYFSGVLSTTCDHVWYTLPAVPAGALLILSLTSAFDGCLIVESPSGDTVVTYDDAGPVDAGDRVLPVSEAGQWRVTVRGSPKAAPPQGQFQLWVSVCTLPALAQLDYTYDKAGNVLTVTDSSPLVTGKGGTLTYTFDALSQLKTVTDQNAPGKSGIADKYVAFTYNDAGQWLSTVRRSGLLETSPWIASTEVKKADDSVGYDGMGRLVGLKQTFGSPVTTLRYGYTFDAASRITQMTSPDGTADYNGYDATDQLTSADYSFQAGEDYTYDDNGNRTNTGYATDTGNRVVSDGTYRYSYDNEGNRAARWVDNGDGVLGSGDTTITEYTWDHRNRLTRVVTRSAYGGSETNRIDYAYDAMDRRIRRGLDADGSGAGTMTYTYNVWQGDHVLLEYADPNGLGVGSDTTFTRRNLYGAAVDEILATDNAAGVVRWGLADHEGTVRDAINSSGQVQHHIKYNAFGKVTSGTVPAEFNFGYTGRPQDAEGGFWDYRARLYDAALGRFLSEDPSGFSAGDMNLYRYVGNNPAALTDPSGLESFAGTATNYWPSSGVPSYTGFTYNLSGRVDYSPSALPTFTPWAAMPEVQANIISQQRQANLQQRQSILDRLGEDPDNISWDTVRALQADRLASNDIYSHEERGFFYDDATWKVAIPLPREDGGLDTMTVRMVVPWLWGGAYFRSVGISENTTPAQQAANIDAANKYAYEMAMKASAVRTQIQGAALAVAGGVGMITAGGTMATVTGSSLVVWGAQEGLTPAVGFVRNKELDTPLAYLSAKPFEWAGMDAYDARAWGRDIDAAFPLIVTAPYVFEPLFPGGQPAKVPSNLRLPPVTAYEVGAADWLQARSVVGDNITIHHVGQAHAMEQLVPGYSRATGPTIAVPTMEHLQIPNLRGTVNLTPRGVLSRDILNLRTYTEAPNASLRDLIEINKQAYPGAF